jgi:hypothetical protein
MRAILAILAFVMLSACGRDGGASLSYYDSARNDGQHVAYGSTDVRLFEMKSPDGHSCTVAVTDNNRGGVAMHCWGAQ